MKRLLIFLLTALPLTLFANSQDTLYVGYYHSPPFVNTENNQLSGISVWVWHIVNNQLDMPVVMKEVPLNNMISELKDGNIDICLNPMTVTSERNKKVDFSYPFFVSHSIIATRESSAWEKGSGLIRSFFSMNFFKAVFLLFVVILIFGFLVWVFERKGNAEQFHPKIHGLWSGIWWSAVTMTTVGYGDKSPKTAGGRIIALIWMFTALMVISGLTASIASSLTVSHLEWNKSSIDEYKNLKVGVIKGSATEQWLKRKFFKNIVEFRTVEEGLVAVEAKRINAFAHDEPRMRHVIKKLGQDMEFEIQDINFNIQFYSFAASKQAPLEIKEKINQLLVEITEEGDWEQLLMEYNLEKN